MYFHKIETGILFRVLVSILGKYIVYISICMTIYVYI